MVEKLKNKQCFLELYPLMFNIAGHTNGRQGTNRADIFTSAAAETSLRVNSQFLRAAIISADQGCRAGRANAGTSGTLYLVSRYEAAFGVNNRPAGLDRRFLLYGDRAYGSGRANGGTGYAINAAESPFKRHGGQQYICAVVNGAQNLVWAGGHA